MLPRRTRWGLCTETSARHVVSPKFAFPEGQVFLLFFIFLSLKASETIGKTKTQVVAQSRNWQLLVVGMGFASFLNLCYFSTSLAPNSQAFC